MSSHGAAWYFAEGSTAAGFNLFYLLQNPGTADASVTVEYLRPVPATPVTRTYTVVANSRQNVWVNQEGPELASTDVSAIITSTIPIIAERAMYLDRQGQQFGAGHVAVGIAESKLQWLLAEGATGPYFDLFVLLANPNDTDATAEVRFLKPDGSVITRTKTVPARSRSNIWVDVEDPALADTAVSTTVRSTNGVTLLVERAMWWPGEFPTWHEAHASAGETGASVQRTFRVGANSRSNVDVGVEFPEAANQRFGTQVRVLGGAPVLVVERAMYWDADGVTWAAGTNAVGTRLP
jgi:hypothetical protein